MKCCYNNQILKHSVEIISLPNFSNIAILNNHSTNSLLCHFFSGGSPWCIFTKSVALVEDGHNYDYIARILHVHCSTNKKVIGQVSDKLVEINIEKYWQEIFHY